LGSTAPENSRVQVVFRNCSVTGTTVTATGEEGSDPTGAAAFLGRALNFGDDGKYTTVTFEGTNSVSGNTIVSQNGLAGGDVYNMTTYAGGFKDTSAVNDFVNKTN